MPLPGGWGSGWVGSSRRRERAERLVDLVGQRDGVLVILVPPVADRLVAADQQLGERVLRCLSGEETTGFRGAGRLGRIDAGSPGRAGVSARRSGR